MHFERAWVDATREPADDVFRPGRGPPLEHDHRGDLGLEQLVLQLMEPLTQLGDHPLVAVAR